MEALRGNSLTPLTSQPLVAGLLSSSSRLWTCASFTDHLLYHQECKNFWTQPSASSVPLATACSNIVLPWCTTLMPCTSEGLSFVRGGPLAESTSGRASHLAHRYSNVTRWRKATGVGFQYIWSVWSNLLIKTTQVGLWIVQHVWFFCCALKQSFQVRRLVIQC